KNFAARTPQRLRTHLRRPPILSGERKANAAVFSRKITRYRDPEHVFLSLFRDECPAFWLDSEFSKEGNQNRFSFMGATSPQSYWVSHSVTEQRLTVTSSGRRDTIDSPLLDFLQSELSRRCVEGKDLPFEFNGGFVGYLGYEIKAECGSASQHKAQYP